MWSCCSIRSSCWGGPGPDPANGVPPGRATSLEIPPRSPDVLRADNVERLRTRLVLQGANIPFTPEAERALHERGTLVVPDVIANAGGVICAALAMAENRVRSASRLRRWHV